MTRDEILDAYRPLRATIKRLLRDVTDALLKSGFTRALDIIAPWAEMSQLDGDMFNMVMDIAVFEPDKKGRRGIDRFLAKNGGRLSRDDRDLVERMSRASFSLFRMAETHEMAGVWLEDLLDDDRRIWVVDEGLEASASPNAILSVRLFDAGSFHAGFGIVTQPGDETLGPCLAAKARRVPLESPGSLAALVYSDHIAIETPVDEDEMKALEELAELFDPNAALIEHDERPRKRGSKKRLPTPPRK